jgi:CHAT domain-containing protein
MTAFHRQLRITGRAEALRRAQLQLIAKGSFAHPYFWAAFSLIGASR